MLIKEVKLEEETVLEIGKFTILWGLFEEKYCRKRNKKNVTIEEIYSRISVDNTRKKAFAQSLQYRREITQDDSYIDDGLHPEGAWGSPEKYCELMREFLERPLGMNSNVGCLLVIQRIRNNMMHGLKVIGDLNAQRPLFQAMNDILESIV